MGSECRDECPKNMYVNDGACVKECPNTTAVQVLSDKKLCSADCLYYQDGDQRRCVSDNKCPDGKPYLKNDKECVENCGSYRDDIIDGSKVCTNQSVTTDETPEETTIECQNFVNNGICQPMCGNGQYYYVDGNGNKVCVDECPSSEGFRVVDRSKAADGVPRCMRDCGDAYEEDLFCVQHCESGHY